MSDAPANVHIDPASQHGTFALVDLCSGRVHSLQLGPNPIGRSDKCRVVLDDPAISRRHAVVMVHESGGCEVGDADSRNGVFRNGRRLQGVAPLVPGDVLQISDFRFLLAWSAPGYSRPLSFSDEALGVVVWNAADSCWHFGISLGAERFVPASYSPTDYSPPDRASPAAAPEWQAVRVCCRQAKAREAEARVLVARRGNPVGMLTLPDLIQVLVTPTGATLVYEESSSGAVCVTVDPAGTFVTGAGRISEVADDSR